MAKRRKKVVRRRAPKNKTTLVQVGVMGRAVQPYALTTQMTAQELADKLSITFTDVEASKNGTSNFVEIKGSDLVNGYKAILFTPQVDGGV